MDCIFFPHSLTLINKLPLPWSKKVGVIEDSRTIDGEGIVHLSFDIINNSNELIRIKKIESPLNVRWFEDGVTVFWLGEYYAPEPLDEVGAPYCLPTDIPAKQIGSFTIYFSYPNTEAKLSLKKASYWGYSPEYVLHLK